MRDMQNGIRVEVEREDDGRWLAEVPALSGALAYGQSRDEAVIKVEALALRILAERLEHGEPTPELGVSWQRSFGSAGPIWCSHSMPTRR